MSSLRFGVLDIYDDQGQLLKKAVPESSEIPDFVKVASQVGPDDHANLFALVILDEDGHSLRKFATADAGNTWLSALYFGLTHDRLPPEAEKVAAANLLQACEAYDIDPPACLLDLSGDDPPESNLVYLDKLDYLKGSVEPAVVQETALPGRYPLDTAQQASQAQTYFEDHERQLTPKDRHTFAVKTAAAVMKAGIPVSASIARHAGESYSPLLQGHLDVRFHHLTEVDAPKEQRVELQKLAAARTLMHPVEFAEALEKFDRDVGFDALWDKTVSEPWYSTFGADFGSGPDFSATRLLVKVANETFSIDPSRLQALVDDGTIGEHFGPQLSHALQGDAGAVLASLPTPTRKLIAQLASE